MSIVIDGCRGVISYYNDMVCKYTGIQSVQMLTGSQLSVLQKEGRTESGRVSQLNARQDAREA